jgi:hypothetical protein
MSVHGAVTKGFEALRDHQRIAHTFELGESSAKIAWIRKARALLLMIDPQLELGGRGILARVYRDLREDLDAINAVTDPFEIGPKVNERHKSATSTVEALTECFNLAPQSILVAADAVNPYFFELPRATDENLLFVLMPFSEVWSDRIWRDHLKPIVEGIDLTPRLVCKRADDLYGHDVLLDIVAAIRSARVVVADITSRNPNVFYELGVAHSFGKRVVLLTQTVTDIPFDLLRFRHIIYQDNSDGYRELEKRLKTALVELLA